MDRALGLSLPQVMPDPERRLDELLAVENESSRRWRGSRAARRPTRVYLVGESSAILGWRDATIDLDFVQRPEDGALLRELPSLKERVEINRASPSKRRSSAL